MNKKYITISIIIAIPVFLFFIFYPERDRNQKDEIVGFNFELEQTEEATARIDEIEEIEIVSEDIFLHQNPNFSFQKPKGFTIGEVDEGEGSRSIIVQNTDTGLGFQIFVSSFDENISVLTESRIRQDLPALIIDKPQKIQVSGSEGLAFVSQNQSFGKSREVWFVHKGFLYQISTYIESEALLQKVLETFEILL